MKLIETNISVTRNYMKLYIFIIWFDIYLVIFKRN